MGLLSCQTVLRLPVRFSRGSVVQYRRRRSLLKDYKVEKSTPDNIYAALNVPSHQIAPVNSSKTSITIDVLGEETYPQISEWRRQHLLRKARRVLPLPISLTTDEQIGRVWKQKFLASLEAEKSVKEKDEEQFEEIPEIVKILAKEDLDSLKNVFGEEIANKYRTILENREKKKNVLVEAKKSKLSNVVPYFPFEKALKKSEDVNQSNEIAFFAESAQNKLIDAEYDNFRAHHELVQYLADSMNKVEHYEYTPEVEGWSSQMWLRNYGKADPTVPPSKIPCSGCGAHLHCTATNVPGFMPVEKFTLFSEEELRTQSCQRCEFLKKYNVALTVSAPSDDYPELISKIQNTDSLVILLVDLLDFPCSVWPGIVNLIGEKQQIYIVGNKVDLLPKDDERYLERVKQAMKESLRQSGIGRNTKIRDVSLISAKTGHGVEDLVTKLLRDLRKGQQIYLIGCTNSGKSTLFNVLMQTDLCALRDQDLMARATTSVWPGTTLNLLKFPVRKLAAWELQMRLNRLRLFEKNDIAERKLKWTMHRQNPDAAPYALLSARIGSTFRSAPPMSLDEDHPLDKSFKSAQKARPFNPDTSKFSSFLHDTPGALYKDQLLNLLTTEELLRTIPREIITPRTFTLRPQQTLFLAGLGRIDVVAARQHVWLTVFASRYLPVHIVYTEEARRFYELYCGSEMLAVPLGGSDRLEHWPRLVPREFTLRGTGWERSSADIVLSSAGWAAVTADQDCEVVLRAYTPEARGLFLRDPPILPFAVNLKGRRIPNTPCFENRLYTVDQLVEGAVPRRFGWRQQRDSEHISEERIRRVRKFVS